MRTVCKTVLLLVLLHTHQFPRLGAEVPGGLPTHVAWTNTPPAVDLLVRLFVPAAGFRLVMSPFLLGQAFLGGVLGVGQSKDDPLTGVARASLLELARLLQRLAAGPPVSDSVLAPSQILPGRS